MNPNPYESPLPVGEYFHGRKREVQRIIESFQRLEPLSIAVVGLRGMGKTSLLRYIIAPPEEKRQEHQELAEMLNNTVRAMVNVAAVVYDKNPSNIKDFLWESLLRELQQNLPENSAPCSKCSSDDFANEENQKNLLFQALEHQTQEHKRQVLLLFDDFDTMFDHMNIEDSVEVVQTLGGFARMQRVTTIIATQVNTVQLSHHLSAKDPSRMVKWWDLFSPFYLETINLGQMPKEEVESFKERVKGDDQPQFDEKDVEYIYKLAGGHPELTRVAFSLLFDRKQQVQGTSNIRFPYREFTYDVVAKELKESAQRLFLRYWDWEYLTDNHKNILFTLATTELNEDSRESRETSQLFGWGLITAGKGNYQIFSEAFKEFVDERVDPEYLRAKLEELQFQLRAKLEESLSRKALQLFRILYDNPDKEFSEEELREAIWKDKNPNSRAVYLAIHRLKQKMRENKWHLLGRIETVGKGYKYRFRKPGKPTHL
jgi:hypothetical protein